MGTVQNQQPNIERKNCIHYAHLIKPIESIEGTMTPKRRGGEEG